MGSPGGGRSFRSPGTGVHNQMQSRNCHGAAGQGRGRWNPHDGGFRFEEEFAAHPYPCTMAELRRTVAEMNRLMFLTGGVFTPPRADQGQPGHWKRHDDGTLPGRSNVESCIRHDAGTTADCGAGSSNNGGGGGSSNGREGPVNASSSNARGGNASSSNGGPTELPALNPQSLEQAQVAALVARGTTLALQCAEQIPAVEGTVVDEEHEELEKEASVVLATAEAAKTAYVSRHGTPRQSQTDHPATAATSELNAPAAVPAAAAVEQELNQQVQSQIQEQLAQFGLLMRTQQAELEACYQALCSLVEKLFPPKEGE